MTDHPEPGWLMRQLEQASADFATWPEWMREAAIKEREARYRIRFPARAAGEKERMSTHRPGVPLFDAVLRGLQAGLTKDEIIALVKNTTSSS